MPYDTEMIGQKISHYKILEKLGEGGMGVVYKAQDLNLGRFVALKFLPVNLAQSEELKKRFILEAKAASALDHTNICTIYEISEPENGQMYIVMAYYEGETLKEKIESSSTGLPLAEALTITMQVATGLARTHEESIFHRDVKPANIMITKRGEVKLVDFGLAKLSGQTQLTREGSVMGTVAYMSPEQARGAIVDHRTDIWSLGVILYEMLSARLPFGGESMQTIMYAIMNQEPEPITGSNTIVPRPLDRIINRALAKNPNERYQLIDEMIVDLRALHKERETVTQTVRIREFDTETVPHAPEFQSKEPERQNLSIAVLPFADMSPDKDQEYFCDGMTEELIDALSKIEGWRVVSRTSVFAFKGKEENISSIGKQLNVTHALEGSVRKAGTRLRITTQLINVSDGFHLWSEKYDREFDDVFAIQDDIAGMIVEKLTGMTQEKEIVIVKRYTDNIEAYKLYLHARFHLNKRTEEGLRKGTAFCEQAIARDPDYPLAYTGLADGLILLAFQGLVSHEEALPKAKEAVQKALALDSDLAEAHSSFGCVLAIYDRNWADSEQEFKRAIELNPNLAIAHYWYAIWCLVPRGRLEDCLVEIRTARELDPLSLVLNTGIGWQYYFAREYDQAIAALQQVLDLDKDFMIANDILGQAYEQKGMHDEAIVAIERAVELSNRQSLSLCSLGHALAAAGRLKQAKSILAELTKLAKKAYVSAYHRALIYTGLGESGKAIESLEKAYDEHNGWLNFLNVEPRFDGLRSHPKYQALVKKVGLQR